MGYVKERFKETLTVPGVWKVAEYRWKAPKHHFEDIVEKDYPARRIMGTLCEGCGRIFVPPRFICGRCMRRVSRRVPVSQTGTLTGYLVSPPAQKGKARFMGMDAVESGILKEGEQIITGLVRWDVPLRFPPSR